MGLLFQMGLHDAYNTVTLAGSSMIDLSPQLNNMRINEHRNIVERDNFIVGIVFLERPGEVGSVTCEYKDSIVAFNAAGDSFGVPARCLLFEFGDQ
jgi:hypothetical protein